MARVHSGAIDVAARTTICATLSSDYTQPVTSAWTTPGFGPPVCNFAFWLSLNQTLNRINASTATTLPSVRHFPSWNTRTRSCADLARRRSRATCSSAPPSSAMRIPSSRRITVSSSRSWKTASRARWCGERQCEAEIKEETKATTRCIPPEQPGGSGVCIHCGRPASEVAIFAKAY